MKTSDNGMNVIMTGIPKPPCKISDPKRIANERFKFYLDSLSISEHRRIVALILEGCMVKRYTVSSWKNGSARIPLLHQKKIEEIIGKKIFSE